MTKRAGVPILILAAMFFLIAAPVTAGETPSTASGDAPPAALAAPPGDLPDLKVGPIDFKTLGPVTNEFQHRGLIFYGSGGPGSPAWVVNDGANPRSPVLAGSPSGYVGPVGAMFVEPGTGRTVGALAAATYAAGYFDDRNSTGLIAYNEKGKRITLTHNGNRLGVISLVVDATAGTPAQVMTRAELRARAADAAGFAMDLFAADICTLSGKIYKDAAMTMVDTKTKVRLLDGRNRVRYTAFGPDINGWYCFKNATAGTYRLAGEDFTVTNSPQRKDIIGPEVMITANGVNPELELKRGNTLIVETTLKANGQKGKNADWFIMVNAPLPAPFNWFYFKLGSGWVPGMRPTTQAPLNDFGPKAVLKTKQALAPGVWRFYFLVDTTVDGRPTLATASWDNVNVKPCKLGQDDDNDRLDNCYETNTKIFVSKEDTGSDPNDPDTDDDGIRDGDEVLGTLAGLDLPALGAHVLRKDIFFEYDWFIDSNDCALHTHKPTAAALDRVTTAFANAPVTNPDGTRGIRAHHDYRQGGVFTGGNYIADANGVLAGGVNSAEFIAYKAANFDSNREGYFHYVILPHRYNTSSGSSGQAELPGDDFIVSLQCFNTTTNIANTILHEGGHNLNLRHGGNTNCNYKPNYNSIMNYRFQFPGIDNSGCDAKGNGILNYSVGSRISLTETNLNETKGVCGSTPINWDGDGTVEASVSTNIQYYDNSGAATYAVSDETADCGGTLTTLTDYNDWAAISLTSVKDADGMALTPPEIIDCDNPAPPDNE